jgi:hypothetical protein
MRDAPSNFEAFGYEDRVAVAFSLLCWEAEGTGTELSVDTAAFALSCTFDLVKAAEGRLLFEPVFSKAAIIPEMRLFL